MKPIFHTKRWFLNRVGKRIYRDWRKCCAVCDEVAKNGLIIHNKQHAEYLYMCQNDFAVEKIYLNYRDKK